MNVARIRTAKIRTKQAAITFAAVMVLVSIIAFSLIDNLPAFADLSLPQHISADQLILEAGDGTGGGPALPSVLAALTPLLEDNFDRTASDVGTPSGGGTDWVDVENPGAGAAVVVNGKLFFSDTSDVVNRPLARNTFTERSTGILTWDFDFDWARTGNEGTYRFLMQLGDSNLMSDASQNSGAGVNLIWTSINGAHQSLGFRKAGANTALAVVSGAKHISVVADLDAQTYSVAVGGAVIQSNIPFDSNVSLDTVRFFTDSLNDNNFSGRTIDNLVISTTEEVGNTPPVAQAGDNQGVQVGATVNLDGSGSTDANGDPLTYIWTLTTVPTDSTASLTGAATANPSFEADLAGTYVASLVVNDGTVDSTPDMVTITAAAGTNILLKDDFNRAASATVGIPSGGGAAWDEVEQAGASAVIAANQLHFAATSDLVNLPLVKRAFPQVSDGTLQWDFDFDWARTGNEGTYRFLMQLGDSAVTSDDPKGAGAGVNLIWTSINGAHQSLGYRKAGVNTALAVVSGPAHISVVADLDAQTYSVAVDGSVLDSGIPFDNNVPLNQVRFFTDSVSEKNFSGLNIDNVSVFSGSAGNFPPVAQDGAVNTAKDVPVGLVLAFTDPDGTGPNTFSIVTQPIGGVLTGVDSNRTYTPNSGFTGVDPFTWRVNDGQADSNVATMTVTVTFGNVAPVAQDDAYSALQDTPLNVGLVDGVLANDDDANGDTLTAAVIDLPSSGVLTLNGDGSFIFVPAGGFSGDVQFTYVADDGPLVSNVAIVSINVAVDFDTLNLQPVNAQANVSLNPTLEIDCSVGVTTAAQYQIATNVAFTTAVYDSGENINDTCSHLASAGLNPGTNYFWRGRIRDDPDVWTPWSQPTSFTTVNATPIFANIFQDGLDGYDGAGDADIRGSALNPTQVVREWDQGAQDVLRTGRRLPNQPTDEIYRSLLKFDLDGGLTDPDAVVNAYIELTGWFHTDSNHLFQEYNSMYELNKPWGEGDSIKGVAAGAGEVSWTYTAQPDEWEIPGAASASDTDPNADRSETALVRMLSTNQEGLKSIWSSQNLVDAVKGWISDPANNYGVLIKADDETSKQTLHRASREALDSPEHPCPGGDCHPKLVIVSTESIQGLPNAAPVAADQSVSTGVNQSLALLLGYTDPDGTSPYTFTIVTGPSHGALTGSGANRTYTPDTTGFIGTDSFTWRVNDGQDEFSNLATVSITISQSVTLLSDNFNRADGQDVGPGWVEVEPVGASAVIANQKLHFADTSDLGNRPLVKRSFPQVSDGTLRWDFDFNWARTGNEGTYRFLMQLGDSAAMSDASQNTGAGVNLIWTTINGTHQTLGYNEKGVNTALAVMGGPAAISVSANLDTKIYSVSVNGSTVGTGIPFNANVSLDTVRFLSDNLNEVNFSGRTIDDLNIFYLSTP